MGRRKRATAEVVEISAGSIKKLSTYTRRRLEQMAESQLEEKAIEIKSGTLKDGLFCHFSYDHTVAANTTNGVAVKSAVPVHEDLVNAFRDLNVHLAVVCEEIHPDEIEDIDNLPQLDPDPDMSEEDQLPMAVKLSRFSVSSFRIVGNGENEGVILTGQKRLSTHEYVKLETPITKWQGEYAFVNELHVAVFNLVEEIEQYMNGKQAPPRQQELDFASDDNQDEGFENGEDL